MRVAVSEGFRASDREPDRNRHAVAELHRSLILQIRQFADILFKFLIRVISVQEHDEFITAEPSCQILTAAERVQFVCDHCEISVTADMPVTVVDFLQPVRVNHAYKPMLCSFGMRNQILEIRFEPASAQNPRKHVNVTFRFHAAPHIYFVRHVDDHAEYIISSAGLFQFQIMRHVAFNHEEVVFMFNGMLFQFIDLFPE